MEGSDAQPVFELESSDSYENASLEKFLTTYISKKENLSLVLDAARNGNFHALHIASYIIQQQSGAGRPKIVAFPVAKRLNINTQGVYSLIRGLLETAQPLRRQDIGLFYSAALEHDLHVRLAKGRGPFERQLHWPYIIEELTTHACFYYVRQPVRDTEAQFLCPASAGTELKQLFPMPANALHATRTQVFYLQCNAEMQFVRRIMPLRAQLSEYGRLVEFENSSAGTVVLTSLYLLLLARDEVRSLKRLGASNVAHIQKISSAIIFLERSLQTTTIFTVDAKGLNFMHQITTKGQPYVAGLAAGGTEVVVWEDSCLRVLTIASAGGEVRELKSFKFSRSCGRTEIVRVVHLEEHLKIVATSSQIFYLAHCQGYGYLLLPSSANKLLDEAKCCIRWSSIYCRLQKHIVEIAHEKQAAILALDPEVDFLRQTLASLFCEV